MSAPDNMIEVSRERFFAFVMTATHNITYNLDAPSFTTWEAPGRRPIGRDYPGWRNPGDAKSYWLTHAALAELNDARLARAAAMRAAKSYT